MYSGVLGTDWRIGGTALPRSAACVTINTTGEVVREAYPTATVTSKVRETLGCEEKYELRIERSKLTEEKR
jgi:hypothetical protein